MDGLNTSKDGQKYKSSTKKILLILAIIYFGLVSALIYYAYTSTPDPCGDGVCSKDENCISCQGDCSCNQPKKLTTTTTRSISTTTTTSYTNRCSETDNGIDIYMAGKATVYNSRDAGRTTYSDNCVGENRVMEYYCQEDNIGLAGNEFNCENGCVNGACVRTTTTTLFRYGLACLNISCYDSDDGRNYGLQGTTTIQPSNCVGNIYTDTCYPDGTLYEGYCRKADEPPTGLIGYENVKCNGSCVNGACVNDSTQNAVTAFGVGDTCIDSDGGIDYYTKGTIVWGPVGGRDYNVTDMCSDDKTVLSEFYCGEDVGYLVEYVTCPNGCADGACIEEGTYDVNGNDYSNQEFLFEQSTDKIVNYAISTGERHESIISIGDINYNGTEYEFDLVSGKDYYHVSVYSYGEDDLVREISIDHSVGSADLSNKASAGDVTTRYMNLIAGRDSDIKETENFYYQKDSEKLGIYQLFNCTGVTNCSYDGGVIKETLVDKRPNAIQDAKIIEKFSILLKQIVDIIQS